MPPSERKYKPDGAKPKGCLEVFVGNMPWDADEAQVADPLVRDASMTCGRVSGCDPVGFWDVGREARVSALACATRERTRFRPRVRCLL